MIPKTAALLLIGALIAGSGGCSSSNSCSKACKKWKQCLEDQKPESAEAWTCPLSATCTTSESCQAKCISKATCAALIKSDPNAAALFDQCQAICSSSGQPLSDGKTGTVDGHLVKDGHSLRDGADDSHNKNDQSPVKDLYLPSDKNQPDQYQWPDLAKVKDLGFADQSYSGAPFGCKNDADCFGLKCCKLPWGINMCSKSCK